MDEPQKALTPMLLYFATVLVGIFIHGLVILPLLYWIITRKNPYRFMLNMANVLMMAFGTASSMAVLPLNIEVTEKKNKIDYRVTRFVLPLGATVNMDGTALYEAVAAIFVAQYTQTDLGPVSYIVITITATIASMGAAGIPQAGLTMVLVFNAVGLSTENIALILPLDWLLDRFRTTLNVLGDAFGSAVVHHVCRKGLEEIDEKLLHKTKKDDESAKKEKTNIPKSMIDIESGETVTDEKQSDSDIEAKLPKSNEQSSPGLEEELPNSDEITVTSDTSSPVTNNEVNIKKKKKKSKRKKK